MAPTGRWVLRILYCGSIYQANPTEKSREEKSGTRDKQALAALAEARPQPWRAYPVYKGGRQEPPKHISSAILILCVRVHARESGT